METLLERKAESIDVFYTEHYDRYFLQAARFVSKRGGTLEDAKDIFHDALIILYEKITQRDFELRISEEAYMMGTVKNLWSASIRRELKKEGIGEAIDATDPDSSVIDTPHLYNLVVSAGKKCLDLLNDFYLSQKSLKEITVAFGFGSEHSASVQKYKCIEKIRETIKQKSLHYEDFLE
jgi:DNA-directed RNA polymerase specialized sigma24 family protein